MITNRMYLQYSNIRFLREVIVNVLMQTNLINLKAIQKKKLQEFVESTRINPNDGSASAVLETQLNDDPANDDFHKLPDDIKYWIIAHLSQTMKDIILKMVENDEMVNNYSMYHVEYSQNKSVLLNASSDNGYNNNNNNSNNDPLRRLSTSRTDTIGDKLTIISENKTTPKPISNKNKKKQTSSYFSPKQTLSKSVGNIVSSLKMGGKSVKDGTLNESLLAGSGGGSGGGGEDDKAIELGTPANLAPETPLTSGRLGSKLHQGGTISFGSGFNPLASLNSTYLVKNTQSRVNSTRKLMLGGQNNTIVWQRDEQTLHKFKLVELGQQEKDAIINVIYGNTDNNNDSGKSSTGNVAGDLRATTLNTLDSMHEFEMIEHENSGINKDILILADENIHCCGCEQMISMANRRRRNRFNIGKAGRATKSGKSSLPRLLSSGSSAGGHDGSTSGMLGGTGIRSIYTIFEAMPIAPPEDGKDHSSGETPSQRYYFFDSLECVRLRKYKDAIREYVFKNETEGTTDRLLVIDDILHAYNNSRISNAKGPNFLNDDYLVKLHVHRRHAARQIWIDYKTEYETKRIERLKQKQEQLRQQKQQKEQRKFKENESEKKETDNNEKEGEKNEIQSTVFKHRNSMLDELKLPKILEAMDIVVYGDAIWDFILHQMSIKYRVPLWNILKYIASEMSPKKCIKKLNQRRYRNILVKLDVEDFDQLCLIIVKNSRYPVATSLYFAAYIKQYFDSDDKEDDIYNKYIDIAIEWLSTIESDHLLALILEIPSDIDYKSIWDIAIEYKLFEFMQFERLQPILHQLWIEFEFLNPEKSFALSSNKVNNARNDIALWRSYQQLFEDSKSFYYSPMGLEYISFIFYCVYLTWVSLYAYLHIYPFTEEDAVDPVKYVFWGFNFGYIIAECAEVMFEKLAYFRSISNYWDIVISAIWIIMFIIRYVIWDIVNAGIDERYRQGEVDEVDMRNNWLCQLYMALFSCQMILLWTRLSVFWERHKYIGPLLEIVIQMVNDVLVFSVLVAIFLLGCVFAFDYTVGDDIDTLRGFPNCFLYAFLLLVGQNDWDALSALDTPDELDRTRLLQTYGVIFCVFGTVLLLNLLIALMASTYDTLRETTKLQIKFNIMQKSWELVVRPALMPPPFNILVVLFGLLITGVTLVLQCLTCFRFSLNIDAMLGTQYDLHNLLERKRLEKSNHGHGQDESKNSKNSKNSNSDGNKFVNNKRTSVTHEFEPFQKDHCRFCRNAMKIKSDGSGIVKNYFELFNYYAMLDGADKDMISNMLINRNICEYCYRPYIRYPNGDTDRLYQYQALLELLSYVVFKLFIWIPMLVALLIPAGISKLNSWCRHYAKEQETNKLRLLEYDEDITLETFEKNSQFINKILQEKK